ncbi:MAG: YgeY family selenium metabolism-linked hydrolase [Chloroflexi bacterium]|nr:YgeY family selenium metabolism-linked hydrolase [Chloroflexota bacterium]MDL1882766.1 YgeY family selenium metabolism-linked hydrolase [Anaerolineae bacterium CFX8]
MIEQQVVKTIQTRVAAQRADIIAFLRELCAIPSYDSQIRAVGERAEAEMKKLGFDEVWWDKMGNVVGRIGDGPRKLLYDSHIDTVGIGDPDSWEWDPFQGKVENGIFFARGACDEKGSTPGMIYGLALAKELGLLDGFTGYYFGNMEEWNDGSAPHALVEVEGLRPDFVVIGEPTRMQVYRGHKGRVEMQVMAKGKSAHAASNFLGDNAIYKLLPVIEAISKLEPELGDDPFLGHGRITVTDMRVKTPSINAVPDEAIIYIDRRITFGEEPQAELERIRRVIGSRSDIEASILLYNDPSYTGFVFPLDKIYPAWALPEDHPYVQAGVQAGALLWGEPLPTGKWDFSTNGTYWAGKAGIPSIGFGPGDEIHAHTVIDQVKLDDVVRATEWYALLPGLIQRG